MMACDQEIRQELYRAMERLGMRADLIAEARVWEKQDFYDVLEAHDAPHKLLAVVGSWGDTLEDAEVLAMLKTWNETGDLKFDRLIASTRNGKR